MPHDAYERQKLTHASIFLADLHFKESPDPVSEGWQKNFFESIIKECERVGSEIGKKQDIPVIILGDLTDAKGRHPSHLVNYIVGGFKRWKDSGIVDPYILWGNHDVDMSAWMDYLSHKEWRSIPFFNFLIQAELAKPISLLKAPYSFNVYPTDSEKERADVVFFHGPVVGSKTTTGYQIDKGIDSGELLSMGGIAIGGDIHKPQTMEFVNGNVVYVGSYGYTETIRLKRVLECQDPREFLRGYMCLFYGDGKNKLLRYGNRDLGVTMKCSVVVDEDGSLSVDGYKEGEFFLLLQRFFSHPEYPKFKNVCVSMDISSLSGQDVNSSKRAEKMGAATEASIKRLSDQIARVIDSAHASVEFRYRKMYIDPARLVHNDSPMARMFSMTSSERVDVLKSDMSSVNKEPEDDIVLEGVYDEFKSLYSQYETSVMEGEEDSDEAEQD